MAWYVWAYHAIFKKVLDLERARGDRLVGR